MKQIISMFNISIWRKLLLFIFVSFSLLFSLSAQSVEKAFVNMPDEYYLSLPTAQRKEMVKAYKKDTTAISKNRFRGQSSILLIDSINQFMSIQNTINSKVALKILKNGTPNASIYYALIFTACAPVCDSHIGFYNADWSFLKNSLLPKITILDFLDTDKIQADGKKVESVAEQFDIVFIQTHFVDNGSNIEATLNSEKFMDKDSFTRLRTYLKGDKILFTWENTTFKKTNCHW